MSSRTNSRLLTAHFALNHLINRLGVNDLSCRLEYSVQLHRCLVADSLKEASEKIKLIAGELEQLAFWEKEGKIKSFGEVDWKGFLGISLEDESIGPDLRKMKIVLVKEFDDFFDDEECYPELFEDDESEKNKVDEQRLGGK